MTKTIDTPKVSPPPADLYQWSIEQASHLRAGRLDLVDILNVADEISDVGHSEYDKLERALAVLLQHMLKWDLQAERRSRSWETTIEEQRARTVKQLKRNPSLKSKLDDILVDAFATARRSAYSETGLPKKLFPDACPYSWSDVMDRRFTLDHD
ncbi:DUF29 domain-containing protein [Beijerinckia sp. L45]|uniref:DUF29 domain-containing protein n=1 Tax=Beijerinckia sp. L45 TaxID=1641855 RepID=UPI00131D24BF|nr:DUF29 domain-containing protein [Beijerinckia sp. L45]